MNCPRSHTCWWSKRLYWKAALKRRASAGWGTQENCSASSWLEVSGFVEMGVNFRVVCARSFCSCPCLVWLRAFPGGMHISQSIWIPAWVFLGGWQDILWAGISSLFSTPPHSSRWRQFVSSLFPIGTFSCETTYASSYFHAWPGQMVPVHSSLTLFHFNAGITVKVDLLITIFQMRKLRYSDCIVFSRSHSCILCCSFS